MRILALLIITCTASLGQAAPCDRLDPQQRKQMKQLFKEINPYACCDESLDRCLKQFKVCKLAKRLRDDVCRRLAKGQAPKRIKSAMERRARSMIPTRKRATIDLSQAAAAGDPQAPVTVVAYACARCPFCSKVVPELYRLATSSGLKGKVKVHFRPFPIRGHPGSVEGGLAFVAAEQLGKIWPYLLKIYSEYDSYKVDKLTVWAKAVDLDLAEFKRLMAAKETRKSLVQSKKEGLRNGVDATPTLFINGRKYHGDMDRDTLLDVLDEEADRVKGRQFCGKK